MDTGANQQWMLATYKAATNEVQVFMGNSSTSKGEGKRKIVLRLTFRKELTLNNVLYVSKICKNLVSGAVLHKNGFNLVFLLTYLSCQRLKCIWEKEICGRVCLKWM